MRRYPKYFITLILESAVENYGDRKSATPLITNAGVSFTDDLPAHSVIMLRLETR